MVLILDTNTVFQITKYLTMEAERIPAGTYVCASFDLCSTITKTGRKKLVVVQMPKSPLFFRYCCNSSNISLLDAKQGEENPR